MRVIASRKLPRDSAESIFAARHQDVSQGPLGKYCIFSAIWSVIAWNQKKPRVRKIFVRNSGAGNGCANFMDAWKNFVLSAGKSMSLKFLVLEGGVFWVLGGGKCRFYFYGREDFSDRRPGDSQRESGRVVREPRDDSRESGHLTAIVCLQSFV